jgi:ABC-type branched-subunit amino acid transport system substrate-binding protein
MMDYKQTQRREAAMRRRDLLKYAGATALAAPFVRAAHADQGTIKVGVVGAKTGPLAPGAAATHFPPWRLWAHEINEAGGLKLKDGTRKVELIEYDDRTQPPEAIKAIERLATVDKADWIVGLYSTGFNIAAVPTFTKLGYPQIAVACVTDLEAVKSSNPDAFIAWSYPPDTFGLTDQAKIENLNVKVYYNGIGCAFAGYYGKYGASAENIIGFGGIPDNKKTRAFLKLHKDVTGIDADYNACPYYYANGQVLRQAFEGAGTVDRDAVTDYLKSHTFKTLIGDIDLRSQLQNIAYTVGQWQNGFFRSVSAVGVADSELVPVQVKAGWA